ncbi:DNA mismatch repair protein MutH, partial [Alishewanella sp. SMS9]|nr:DNA mismatch repair protein MutH [Alishewanella sp. SMS9]
MSAKPQSTAELLTNCQRIAGLTLGQLAAELSQPVPKDLRNDKGWVGQLMELA